MPNAVAIKTFEVVSGSTENMWYKITVKFNGTVVDEFLKPTMSEAQRDFHLAGYQQMAWSEAPLAVVWGR